MLGVETIPAILYFSFLFFVPCSPRWLAKKGKFGEAMKIMVKVSGEKYAKTSMEEIKQHLDINQVKATLAGLFSRKMRFIMFIAFAIAFFQLPGQLYRDACFSLGIVQPGAVRYVPDLWNLCRIDFYIRAPVYSENKGKISRGTRIDFTQTII